MNNEEIIKEATEAIEKNLNAGCYVGDLLCIIKEKNAEIERLKNDRIVIELDDEVLLKDFKTEVKKEINTIKSEAYREFNARLYAYKTNIFIKGEELMIIPMSDYDEILKELTESNE